MTQTITYILIGFSIGFLLSTAFKFFRIAKMNYTPNFPYIMAMIAIGLMVIIRLDNIFHLMPDLVRAIVSMLVSFFWFIFASKIYSLLKIKIPL